MYEKLTAFIGRHDLYVLTTHDAADADGLGAELVFAYILKEKGKQFRIINANPVPEQFKFMDPRGIVECWDEEQHRTLPEQAGLLMLDTADLHNTGQMREIICRAKDVFVVDHHEFSENSVFPGLYDSTSASTCELVMEFVRESGVSLDPETALAAYTGIIYDTGFFAYQKTGARTFRAALSLLDMGVSPCEAYHHLCETKSTASLLLQKKALASLTLHCDNRVALQILRQSDFDEAAALPEDTHGLVNIPLKAKNILVSLLFKEASDGKIRCSLRSKGNINVAKMAQSLGGGGHINASGFKSKLDIDKTIALALAMVARHLEKA